MNWEKMKIKELYKRMDKGIGFFNQEKFKEALLIFLALKEEGIIRKNSTALITVLANLGGIYFKLQDYQKSIDFYLEALKIARRLFPEKKEKIRKGMALSLILKLANAGKKESALKLCEFRLQKDPREIFLIEVKGNLLNNLGQYEESIFCFEEMLEKTEKSREKSHILYKIGLNYFLLGELNHAREYFCKGEREDPQNHLNLLGLAQIAWEKKDWSAVIGFLEKAERLAPENISFLPDLIESYWREEEVKKSLPKVQKIIKSKEEVVMAQLLDLLMRVKDIKFKDYLIKKTVWFGWRNSVFWKELEKILNIIPPDPHLLDIFKNIQEEAESQSRKNSFQVGLLKDMMGLIGKRYKFIEDYFSSIGWLVSKNEIEQIINRHSLEKAEDILESVFIKRFKTRYEARYQGELAGFVDKIKKERNEFFSPIKEIADFLERSKDTVIIFDPLQKGGMLIEETTNQLTFRIFHDFPGELKGRDIDLLLDFYKKRLKMWGDLVDLIMNGKVIPPSWASIQQWAEKTTNRLPNNQILLEELQREGNNFKMDLIFQRMEPEIHRRAYPIVSSLLKEKSPVLAARFNQRRDYCSSLAIDYFRYIRKEMKVK